jgi:DNA-binding response OmpR family regulator
MYALYLADGHDVQCASSGTEGAELIDETVDVCLVDRRMPGMSGDELVEEIRDRGYDCGIAMVSAVDLDVETVSTLFDAYLIKPVDGDTLRRIVAELSTLREQPDPVRKQYALLQQLSTLQDVAIGLDVNERYVELFDRVRRLREESETPAERLTSASFSNVLDDLRDDPIQQRP